MELKTFTAQDTDGRVVDSPKVTVYEVGTGSLVMDLVDKSGNALSNPFFGGHLGEISFAAPDGEYDLEITNNDGNPTVLRRVRFVDLPLAVAALETLRVAVQGLSAEADASARAAASSAIVAQDQIAILTASHAAAVAAAAAAAAVVADAVPPGAVMYFGGNSAPVGWLKANGAVVSKTTYSKLFAVIGAAYGGHSNGFFQLPDLRGEFIRGLDDGRGVDAGRAIGSAQAQQMPRHRHEVYGSLNSSTTSSSPNYQKLLAGPPTYVNAYQWTEYFGETESNANETRPRNVALLACIKY